MDFFFNFGGAIVSKRKERSAESSVSVVKKNGNWQVPRWWARTCAAINHRFHHTRKHTLNLPFKCLTSDYCSRLRYSSPEHNLFHSSFCMVATFSSCLFLFFRNSHTPRDSSLLVIYKYAPISFCG